METIETTNAEEIMAEVTPEAKERASGTQTSSEKGKKEKKKRKWPKRVFGALGMMLLALAIFVTVRMWGTVRTVTTVERVDEGLYKVTYHKDYRLDDALKANIITEDDFLKFASDTFFLGVPVTANQDYVACSAFLTRNEEGQFIAGRNFDYSETDLLMVYTHPDDGYASIGMAPLASLNIGVKDGFSADSHTGRLLMMASPYMCVDGMNKKGLMVAVLDLDPPRIRQDSGKPKINTMVAVRMLLDRAATVDEAVEMLSRYDFNSMSRMAQHLYIADAQGNAAVVEWQLNNTFGSGKGFEMHITESPVCTNFWLCNGEWSGKCGRFDTITRLLAENPVNEPEDAMGNLKAASVSWTEWSCVYRLSDFGVDIVLDNKHEKVYHISPDDFR